MRTASMIITNVFSFVFILSGDLLLLRFLDFCIFSSVFTTFGLGGLIGANSSSSVAAGLVVLTGLDSNNFILLGNNII